MKIGVEIVADSVLGNGDRVTTMIMHYPRFIHAEVMTHRMFSRNAASSRAIPFTKMVENVRHAPFIPVVWQEDHKGMQGSKYITDLTEIGAARTRWMEIAENAADDAEWMHQEGEVTKQICNRILEPYLWYTALVTATEWSNFLNLRCPVYNMEANGTKVVLRDREEVLEFLRMHYPVSYADQLRKLGIDGPNDDLGWMMLSESGAEPHMQLLAEQVRIAMRNSKPKKLEPHEWHVPFSDKMGWEIVDYLKDRKVPADHKAITHSYAEDVKLLVSAARCARLSYMTFDNEIDIGKDVELAQRLLKNRHMSPFEHVAQAMEPDDYTTYRKYADYKVYGGWCDNFRGFISLRHKLEHEQ